MGASEHVQRFQKCDWPAVTHAQKSECPSPQRLDVALLDPLTQYSDALDSVDAITVLVETAELVVVQTAASITPVVRMCDMARCHTATNVGGKLTSD
jgi:hypothetical protein